MVTGALGLDAELWDILACPCEAHGALSPVDPSGGLPEGGLNCSACGRTFPIRDGIPVLLIDAAS